MTWMYKLLRIPKTWDEYLDKVKRKGVKGVEISIENRYSEFFGGSVIANIVKARAKPRGLAFVVDMSSYAHFNRLYSLESYHLGTDSVEDETYNSAIDFAKRLAAQGITPVIITAGTRRWSPEDYVKAFKEFHSKSNCKQ